MSPWAFPDSGWLPSKMPLFLTCAMLISTDVEIKNHVWKLLLFHPEQTNGKLKTLVVLQVKKNTCCCFLLLLFFFNFRTSLQFLENRFLAIPSKFSCVCVCVWAAKGEGWWLYLRCKLLSLSPSPVDFVFYLFILSTSLHFSPQPF